MGELGEGAGGYQEECWCTARLCSTFCEILFFSIREYSLLVCFKFLRWWYLITITAASVFSAPSSSHEHLLLSLIKIWFILNKQSIGSFWISMLEYRSGQIRLYCRPDFATWLKSVWLWEINMIISMLNLNFCKIYNNQNVMFSICGHVSYDEWDGCRRGKMAGEGCVVYLFLIIAGKPVIPRLAMHNSFRGFAEDLWSF